MAIPDKGPIVVAPTPTPFDTEDRVDHGMLVRNIERLMPSPLSGFVLGTINGEENALSEDEKAAIVRTVAEVAGSERLVIAGIRQPVTGRYGSTGREIQPARRGSDPRSNPA